MNPLLVPWAAELVLITYRGAKNKGFKNAPIKNVPLPSEYAATFVIYGILAAMGGRAQRPATLFGYGLVVATFLNLWDPTTIGNKKGPAVAKASTVSNTPAPAA